MPAPVRTGSGAVRRNCSSSAQASSFSARLAPAASSLTERSRIAGSECVIVSMRSWPSRDMMQIATFRSWVVTLRPRYLWAGWLRFLLDPDDRFEQKRQDPFPVNSPQGQGDLRLDHAKLDAEIEPRAPGFQRKIALAPRQRIERGRELDLAQLADVVANQLFEQIEDDRASARACRKSRDNARHAAPARPAAARPASGLASR